MWTAIPCIHFHHVKISYWNPLLFSIFLNNSGIVNCHLQHSWLEISLMVLSESSIHRKKLSVRYLIHFPLPCSKTFLVEQFHEKGLLGVRYIFWSFIRPKKRFYKKFSQLNFWQISWRSSGDISSQMLRKYLRQEISDFWNHFWGGSPSFLPPLGDCDRHQVFLQCQQHCL